MLPDILCCTFRQSDLLQSFASKIIRNHEKTPKEKQILHIEKKQSLLDTPYYKIVRCDNSGTDVIENVRKYAERLLKFFIQDQNFVSFMSKMSLHIYLDQYISLMLRTNNSRIN